MLIVSFVYFTGGLECASHSFAYVSHFVFLRDVWSCRSKQARYQLSHPSPLQLSRPSPLQLSHPSPLQLSHPSPLQLSHPSPLQLSHPSPLQLGHLSPLLLSHPSPLKISHPVQPLACNAQRCGQPQFRSTPLQKSATSTALSNQQRTILTSSKQKKSKPTLRILLPFDIVLILKITTAGKIVLIRLAIGLPYEIII
jgi:hypothetical protein